MARADNAATESSPKSWGLKLRERLASQQLSNQIRGLMKTFGLIVSNGRGWVSDGNVRGLLDGNEGLAKIILPLLEAWRDIRKREADLDRQLLAAARGSQATKLLMTIPGIGAVTAVSYVAAIEDQKTSNRQPMG